MIDRTELARAKRDLRRLQSEMAAFSQKVSTQLDAYCLRDVEDWEDRYVREGFVEVEGYANGEASA